MVGKLIQPYLKRPFKGGEENLNVEKNNEVSNTERKGFGLQHLSYISLSVITILLFLVVLLPLLDQVDIRTQYLLNKKFSSSQKSCSFEIVESIPDGVEFNSSIGPHLSTFKGWKKLIKSAKHSIEIGSFYWTLSKWDAFPEESQQGDEIFMDLLEAGRSRNVSIRIVRALPTSEIEKKESKKMMRHKEFQIKFFDFNTLFGKGVLHSKFWIIDRKHLYIGSANLDWRALTQVKELGIILYNCSTAAEDLGKIFDVYWLAGNATSLPEKWPDSLSTIYNLQNPINLGLENHDVTAYFSSSPPNISTKGRTEDLDAVLDIINNAKKYINISVMDYFPLTIYSRNLSYWPLIDNALREAVVNRYVCVRLLVSYWNHTRTYEYNFLKSLTALNNFRNGSVLEVKRFTIPRNFTEKLIPYSRVNHNKFMVADSGALIGTSNWSGDYFTNTGGVSIVFRNSSDSTNIIQEQLNEIFQRDWNSQYAFPLLKRLDVS